MVNQSHHRADVLAEIGQSMGGIGEGAGIISRNLQGTPSEVGALQSVCDRIFASALSHKPKAANRGIGKSRPVAWISRDALFKQLQHLGYMP
jgi:hypothetical protein